MSGVRIPSVTPTVVGTVRSPPCASSSMAEQRTLNPQVLGSNPRGRTFPQVGASGLRNAWSPRSVVYAHSQRAGHALKFETFATHKRRRTRVHIGGVANRPDERAGAT